jgi:nucleoside-diphosphate-sugar epimerase
MGPTLARMARRALRPDRDVIAVSRFSSKLAAAELERCGVRTISCDLLDRDAVARLPDAASVVFMAGMKFGTSDAPELTWMINGVLPSIVSDRYSQSRIVVFSTGCVYPFAPVAGGGSLEEDPVCPGSEYSSSCIARERVFTYCSKSREIPVLIFRLNYAVDLRYGVLHDTALKVWRSDPIDVTMGHVNVIWQGDACARALQSISHASSPPKILNITGRECVSIRSLANRFGEIFGRPPQITGNEAENAWLSNSEKSFQLFGSTTVSLDQMIQATADWIRGGGRSLGKPTHFESRDGKF